MRRAQFFDLIKQTGLAWVDDKVPQLGASLAFYCILSMGPILLLCLAGAGFFFGVEVAHGQIVNQIQSFVGKEGANAVHDIFNQSSRQNQSDLWATLISVITLFIGASGVFTQLQDAFDIIWKVQIKQKKLWLSFLKERLISLVMVVCTGFILLASLATSTAISFINSHTNGYYFDLSLIIQAINFIVSFAVTTLLFAIILKYVPKVDVPWRYVRLGAILTSFLYTIGKSLIGFYLGHSSLSSSYGAAGSIIVILIWVYYSSQILFFGAEFTYKYSKLLDAKQKR